MCVSNSPAEFTETLGYVGEALKDGDLVHVIGYKNRAKNLSSGPNAMILHFPADVAMNKDNVIEVKNKGLMNKLTSPFRRISSSRSMTKSVTNSAPKVEIFETGNYTVVLTNKPTLAYEALESVPENKRPTMNKALLEWYEKTYPNWTIAICCFDNTEMVEADALFWWYKPMDKEHLIFPAIDSHRGGIPSKTTEVDVDHIISFSSLELNKSEKGLSLGEYKDYFLEEHNRDFFPSRVVGKDLTSRRLINGDFWIKVSDVTEDKIDHLVRK